MIQSRDEAKRLTARQIAIADHKVWDRLPNKSQAMYLTLAENIIVTIERKMKDYRWV